MALEDPCARAAWNATVNRCNAPRCIPACYYSSDEIPSSTTVTANSKAVNLLRDIQAISPREQRCALAIGNFDGVHQGHAKLIASLVRHAKRMAGPAVVLTFDPHPVLLLRPEQAPPPLTWTERKAALLGSLGVDTVIAYPTNHKLLELTPSEFFRQIVVELLQARMLVEGPNFHFGKNRQGDVTTLRQLCEQYGCGLEVVPCIADEGEMISSSRIRQLLLAGQFSTAHSMLTGPFRIRGRVIQGAQRGRTLGFPTANLAEISTLIPASGVYAGSTMLDNQRWPAAIHIGPNPTFAENATKIEVHVVGWEHSLYGQWLEVDFLARLRDIQTFEGLDQLKEQLQRDVAQTVATCSLVPKR